MGSFRAPSPPLASRTSNWPTFGEGAWPRPDLLGHLLSRNRCVAGRNTSAAHRWADGLAKAALSSPSEITIPPAFRSCPRSRGKQGRLAIPPVDPLAQGAHHQPPGRWRRDQVERAGRAFARHTVSPGTVGDTDCSRSLPPGVQGRLTQRPREGPWDPLHPRCLPSRSCQSWGGAASGPTAEAPVEPRRIPWTFVQIRLHLAWCFPQFVASLWKPRDALFASEYAGHLDGLPGTGGAVQVAKVTRLSPE